MSSIQIYEFGQLHQVSMKLELRRRTFILLLETLNIDQKMGR